MKNRNPLLICAALCLANHGLGEEQPSTPPLGWNSWTSHGYPVSEGAILDNAKVMAERLKPFGYEYVVIDGGWHIPPSPQYPSAVADQYGQIVDPVRFPRGIRAIADDVHALGLKLGIHIMRGVSRIGYGNDIPVAGTTYRMREVADPTSVCSWSADNYGINMKHPGAQEFYDSYIGQLVSWGVDFIKADDITEHPAEIAAVRAAIKKTGKDVVLSLSPGWDEMPLHVAAFNAARMVRVTSDIWDNQIGIDQGFAAMKRFANIADREFLIDLDIIPFGHLGLFHPRPDWKTADSQGEGKETGLERFSALDADQKYTAITQRALIASPLFIGGDLPTSDEFSFSLLTNREMLACNQNGVAAQLTYDQGEIEIWTVRDRLVPSRGWFGVFNRTKEISSFELRSDQLGLATNTQLVLHSIWEARDLETVAGNSVRHLLLKPGGVVFCRYLILDNVPTK